MDNPLVTICVISYNAENLILETLESIKNQTYRNIELIVADDASTDNTVHVVQSWMRENANCGLSTMIVVPHERNGGTCANLNSGIRAGSGEWIKILAADDLLTESAIEEFVFFVTNHPETQMCLCDCEILCVDPVVKRRNQINYTWFFNTAKKTLAEKQQAIKYCYTYPGPCYFFSRDLYNRVGGFTEKYDLAEEWPFCYKVLEAGVDIVPVEKKLVRYRVSENSISHNLRTKTYLRLLKGNLDFYRDIRRPALKASGMTKWIVHQDYLYFLDTHTMPWLIRKVLKKLAFLDNAEWHQQQEEKRQIEKVLFGDC